MPRPRLLPLALALSFTPACNDDSGGSGSTVVTPTTLPPTTSPATTVDPDPTTTTGSTDSASGTTTAASASTAAPTTTGAPKLDVGSPETTAPATTTAGDKGCTAVDLLFVIDNSPSMGKYQKNLGAAFPGFVDAMFGALPPGTDLHVGITTTSFFVGSCSESTVNCKSQASDQEILAHYQAPTGANNGENGGQGRLFNHDGKSFFAANTSDDPAALKTWFTAAAIAAGETGCSFEMPAAGAGWAADPANAPTNAGFIRDAGAVLLVFVLSDEPDKSPEPVGQFVDKLAAAKQVCGGINCILAAGLVSAFCYDHPADTTLKTFLESFSAPPITGFIDGDPNTYAMVVGDALAGAISQKCDEIDPPG